MRRFLTTTAAIAAVSIGATGVAAHGDHTSYPAGGHTYTVKSGDTLSQIAREHLGSAARWREIAQANGIDDARRLQAGSTLRIPGTAMGAGTRPTAADRDSIIPDPTDLSSRPSNVVLAPASDLRREPENRPRAMPAHPTHPAQEAGPTGYPQAPQAPLATPQEGVRRHPTQHSHDLVPSNREAEEAGATGTSYPQAEQAPLATPKEGTRTPEPSGGRITPAPGERE